MIKKVADEGGYGHFLTEGTCKQWAVRILEALDQVPDPAPEPVAEGQPYAFDAAAGQEPAPSTQTTSS